MDVDELFDSLDVHGFEDVEVVEKEKVLNDVVQEIFSESPWPFLDTFETVDAAGAGVDSTGKVTTTIPFTAIRYIRNNSYPERGIRWVREDDLVDAAIDFTEEDIPTCFYFVGSDLYLWPIPTSGTFRVGMVQVQDDLTAASVESDILLPARHHRILLLGMLFKLHSQEDDAENALMFKQQFDEKLVRMRNDLFKQQYDRSDFMRIYGWGDDDMDA
jgi:hypothetical protein